MPYYMRQNHACRVPPSQSVVFIETDPRERVGDAGVMEHHLLCGAARSWRYDRDKQTRLTDHEFYTREEYWSWLFGRSKGSRQTWVWAHGASYTFVALGVFELLDQGTLSLKVSTRSTTNQETGEVTQEDKHGLIVTGDPTFCLDVIGPEGQSIRLIDIRNWILLDLIDSADQVGIPCPALPGEAGDLADWTAYVIAGREIVAALANRVCRLVKANDMGNLQITIASQSMSLYRHRYLPDGLVVGPDPETRPLEGEAYYGARQEVYYRGHVVLPGESAFMPRTNPKTDLPILERGPVYRLDCNSCYPFVMQGNRFPIRLRRHYSNPPVCVLREKLNSQIGVAWVRMYSPSEPWPIHVAGKTTWATGRLETFLCGPELVRAIDSGYVDVIHQAQTYVSGQIFTAWATDVLALRHTLAAQGDELGSRLIKRLAAALHGKFGQKSRRWEVIPGRYFIGRWGSRTIFDNETSTYQQYRGIAGVTQRLSGDEYAEGAAPIIAAVVTAYAREHMRTARLAAGYRQIVYEDADSLHVLSAGYQALLDEGWIDPTLPGKFKVEMTTDRATYYGLKNYLMGETRVMAGRARAGTLDAHGVWSQTEFARLDSLLMSGMPACPLASNRIVGDAVSKPDHEFSPEGWVDFSRESTTMNQRRLS